MECSSSACNSHTLPRQRTGGTFRLLHRAHLVQPGSRRRCCCQRVVDSMVVSAIQFSRFSMRADVKILIERNPIKDQRGFSLIEVMLSIARLGILAVSFLSAIGTGSMVLFMTDQRQTAKNLAESQLEYVRSQSYDFNDPPSYEQDEVESLTHPGYFISVEVAPLHDPDDGIQKITVTVSHHGEGITQLEGYKTER